MYTTPPSVPQRRLARQARQRFVEGICGGLADLDKTVQDFLTALMNQTGTAREMQSRRDAWLQYQQKHAAWTERTGKAAHRPSTKRCRASWARRRSAAEVGWMSIDLES